MTYLSLTLPGNQTINAPKNIPSVPSGETGIDYVGKIFGNALTIMIIITIVLSLIFIVYAGIQWITSGGDKTKLQSARSKLTWAIGGLIVAFAAFLIVGLIGYFFKVDLLNFSS